MLVPINKCPTGEPSVPARARGYHRDAPLGWAPVILTSSPQKRQTVFKSQLVHRLPPKEEFALQSAGPSPALLSVSFTSLVLFRKTFWNILSGAVGKLSLLELGLGSSTQVLFEQSVKSGSYRLAAPRGSVLSLVKTGFCLPAMLGPTPWIFLE